MKMLTSCVLFLTAIHSAKGQDLKKWHFTGDYGDSIVIQQLNKLSDNKEIYNSRTFLQAMEPVFHRESYYATRPMEEWGYFTYDLQFAHTILSYYLNEVKIFDKSANYKDMATLDSLLNNIIQYINKEVYQGSMHFFGSNLPNKSAFIQGLPSSWSRIEGNNRIRQRNESFKFIDTVLNRLYPRER